jgi:hypothetical protein
MHDLHAQAEYVFSSILAPTLVTGVHPQVRKAWKAIAYTFQQQLDPVLVRDLGAVYLGFQDQSLRIHQEMALPAANLLAAVVSPRLSTHPACLSRLRIYYCATGLGISPEPSAQELADSVVHPFPGAVEAPRAEVVVDGLPRREVAGQ